MFTVFAAANVKIYGHRQAVNLFAFTAVNAVNFGDALLKMQVGRNLNTN